jgi:hypothetical protein
MRAAAGDLPERVLGALALSTITGRNEAYVMHLRLRFELESWDILPREGRAAAAADLASLLPLLSDQHRATLRRSLAGKSGEMRQNLKDALERTYGVTAVALEQIGLPNIPEQSTRLHCESC